MKILLKIGLLSLAFMVVSCNKEQHLSVHNASSNGFYFLNKAKLNGSVAIMSLRGDEGILEINEKDEFTRSINNDLLDNFKVGDNYVFYLINKNDLAVPLVGLKAAKMYDSIVVPVSSDITRIDLYVKDTVGDKLSLSSRVKSVKALF